MLTPIASQRFAKCMEPDEDAVFKAKLADQTFSLRTIDSIRVSLIDDDVGIAVWKEFFNCFDHLFEWCDVAFHAVHTFDGNKYVWYRS